MSKSVLVMETPERGCISCSIGQNDSNCRITRIYCPIAEETAFDEEAETVPDWCPLEPLLKYKSMEKPGEYEYGKMHGWNNCINVITGGNADD